MRVIVRVKVIVIVKRPNIFLAITLHDEHHHVLPLHRAAVGREMDWAVNHVQLITGEELGVGEHILVDGANHRERGVQNQRSLGWSVHLLIGIADGDGAHSRSGSPTHTRNGDGDVESET